MTAAGDAGLSLVEVEGRIREIEAGLARFELPAGFKTVRSRRPARPGRHLKWALTTLLAICGSAAVIGPFLLIVTS